MQDNNKNRFSIPVVAAITGLILAAGGGAAWWAKSSLNDPPQVTQSDPSPIVQEDLPTVPKPITQDKVVEVYWLNPSDDSVKLAANTMTFQKSIKSERVLETALETLLTNPPEDSAHTTAIPPGTKLLGVTIDDRGIKLNLSKEFASGGGSASMTSRLAQVIYTATSSSNGDRVWINIEGKPLEKLGEEGLIINQPMTREDFKNNFTL
ncbi:GerMN domain-containing protein [Waterburya agarophytonicola K14]|uniref:GerMN domain-containing protein n=1 Tax=Waterburya agarophytonicola KI4 TaxID=2874699 RepID=A0A964BQ95_9CYAN|nr:GerMN domain-containing protein [Waterburya agarophytonicola]MCC0177618.1 GerMN domain-containing protein [Waterburya agarophytonicola KI4]